MNLSIALLFIVGILPGLVFGYDLLPRIFDGIPEEISNYPFMMSVVFEGCAKCRLAATLIRPEYVVTAAFYLDCFENINNVLLWVKYNCSDIKGEDCRLVKIVEIIKHPSYQPNTDNQQLLIFDVAIMKLAHPLNDIEPVNLPKYHESIPISAVGISLQFGDYSQDTHLRAYNRRVIDCKHFYPTSGTNVCAFGGRGYTQPGTPLLIGNTLYGIASRWSYKDVRLKAYTDVTHVVNFIEKTVGKNQVTDPATAATTTTKKPWPTRSLYS